MQNTTTANTTANTMYAKLALTSPTANTYTIAWVDDQSEFCVTELANITVQGSQNVTIAHTTCNTLADGTLDFAELLQQHTALVDSTGELWVQEQVFA